MSSSGDDSGSSRLGFYAHRPASTPRTTSTPPGVALEYAHQILDRVTKLSKSLEIAQNSGAKSEATAKTDSIKAQLESIKSEPSDPRQEGIEVLKECALRLDEQLNEITTHKFSPNL